MDPFGSIWSHLDPLGSIRIHWDPYGFITIHYIPLQSICIHLHPLKFIGIHRNLLGSIGIHWDPIKSIWIHWNYLNGRRILKGVGVSRGKKLCIWYCHLINFWRLHHTFVLFFSSQKTPLQGGANYLYKPFPYASKTWHEKICSSKRWCSNSKCVKLGPEKLSIDFSLWKLLREGQ